MNLNNSIVITLTESGVKIYKDYCNNFNDNSGYYPGLVDNILTIEIWNFAHIFGQELWNGNPKPPCEMGFQFAN